jgi:hypothetical protein
MERRYEVLGVNDDRDFCMCCGKENLARVVWIQDNETGEVKHFGTTCAASPQKGFGVDKDIKRAINSFKAHQQHVWMCAHRQYRKLGGKYDGNVNTGWRAIDMTLLDRCVAEVMSQQRAA